MATRMPIRTAPPPPPVRKGYVEAYEALYSYKSKHNKELSFEEGDILYVLDQSDSKWWMARQDKKEGLIPSNYVSKENVRIPIVDAARRGNLVLLNECLRNGISVNSLDKTGSSALHAACMAGHLDCVQRLLQEPKIELNLQNKLGDTPLHNASLKGHHEICDLLLSKRVQTDIRNSDDKTAKAITRSSLVLGVFDEEALRALGTKNSHLTSDQPCDDYDDSDDDA